MRVLAVASGKGGVGKTTIAVHLAVGFANEGKRVLLVDLEPRAHATKWFLGQQACLGIAESMHAEELRPEHVAFPPERRGLVLSPSSPALETVEATLSQKFGGETLLRRVLRAKRQPQFDVVVLDCPPGTRFLTRAAIYAADHVIVPVLPGGFGVDGAIEIAVLTEQIRKAGKVKVDVLGCVLFASDDRELMTEESRKSIRKLKLHLFGSEVRVSTAGKGLPLEGKVAFDPGVDARGFEDYRALIKETEARL